MEQILHKDYINKTYKNVKSNKGAGGVDGMSVDELKTNVNDGYVYVVDMDLEKFFDTVCQNKLIEVLLRTIKDGRVISLISKYLSADVISKVKCLE